MSQILDDIRNVFRRKDDSLTQIILINIGVFVFLGLVSVGLFLFHVELGRQVFTGLLMRQLELSSDLYTFATHPWTAITYFFTQQDPLHLIFNLLFLYWFGQLVQEYLGSARLFALYVLGGLAGGFLFVLSYNTLPVFEPARGAVLIGASGAIYAVVLGAATLLPNHTFNLLFIGPVRIVYIAWAYLLLSFFNITSSNPGGNIAHIGGAIMGIIYIRQLRSGRDLGWAITVITGWVKNLFNRRERLRISQNRARSYEPVTASGVATRSRPTQPGPKTAAASRQEEVDAILDKMLESGYNSLTLEEKRKLDAAGENPA